jgi:hypothetical protein
MTAAAKPAWNAVICAAAVAATGGLLSAMPAQAGRVITASDSGGGPVTGAAAGLFSCNKSNFFTPAFDTGPFDCAGALGQRYSETPNYSIIESLVNSRIGAWTSSNESAHASFTNTTVTFDTATQGDFVLVFSGSWLSDLSALNNAGRTGWSSYYLLEDIEILNSPLNSLRYNFNWTDNSVPYSTRGLAVEAVSFYRISRMAVPEPGALALVGLALAGLLLAGRRGRRVTAASRG